MRRVFLLPVLAFLSLAPVSDLFAGTQNDVPASNFFQQPSYVDALISPDGHLVASIIREYGSLQVSIYDLTDGIGGVVYAANNPDQKVLGMRWVSNDTLVFNSYFWSNAWNSLGDMYSVVWGPLKDGKPQVRFGQWDNGIWLASAGDPHGHDAMVAEFPDHWGHTRTTLYKVDLSDFEPQFDSGHRLTYINGEYRLWLAKPDGRFGVIGREDDDGSRHYEAYGSDSGKWVELKNASSDPTFFPLAYAPDTDNVVVEREESGQSLELWTYDLQQDKYLAKLYGDNRYPVENILYGGYKHQVVGLVRHAGDVQDYLMLGTQDPALQQQLDQKFPGSHVVVRDKSSDGKQLLLYASSASMPGAYAVLDTNTGKLTAIGEARPWLDNAGLVGMSAGTFKMSDGTAVDYTVSTPSASPKTHPTIVMLQDGALLTGFDPAVQYLVSRGFSVVHVDYQPLTAMSAGQAALSPKQRESKIVEGIAAAISDSASKYQLDRDRICLFGTGIGGYLALMSIIDEPKVYRCAATYSGVTDLSLIYEPNDAPVNAYMKRLSSYLGTGPETSLQDLVALSPAYLASKLSRPVFVSHGANDDVVDEEHAYRLQLMMDKAGVKYDYHVYQNEGDELTALDDEVDFYEHLASFVEISIKPMTNTPASIK